MKIVEYLESRHENTGMKALTKAEAKILGIEYKPVKGWLKVHEQREITIVQMEQLEKLAYQWFKAKAIKKSHAAKIHKGLGF